MNELAESQEALLLKLKQKGPQTAKNLAEMLAITTMGVRQHLAVLTQKGLVVEGEEQKLSRGRPVRPWQLTQKGHQRFPDSHSLITVELIAAVRDTFGDVGLEKIINNRTAASLSTYSSEMEGIESLPGKLKKLAEIRSREGYMAEFEKISRGEWLLIENHCPICAAATACQNFCRSELDVFQAVLAPLAKVAREEHLLAGARRCVYRVVAVTP